MSLQIAEAFALARPDERVTFYLSQPQTSVKRVITSGGIYLRGTELHFILGNWQTLYGIPTYGMIYDRRYPMRPNRRQRIRLSSDPGEAMIPQRHSLWDTLLANTNDELVIDLTKIDSLTRSLPSQDARHSRVAHPPRVEPAEHGLRLFPFLSRSRPA